jgi:hypothetical protein
MWQAELLIVALTSRGWVFDGSQPLCAADTAYPLLLILLLLLLLLLLLWPSCFTGVSVRT